jgi:hypothetical protein
MLQVFSGHIFLQSLTTGVEEEIVLPELCRSPDKGDLAHIVMFALQRLLKGLNSNGQLFHSSISLPPYPSVAKRMDHQLNKIQTK